LIVELLSIGQLARRAEVGVETVRYYERRGLLQEPQRRQSGYRQYGAEAVSRLQFIRRAKDLGFTLREIGELLSLGHDPSAPAVDVKRRAEAKVADIEGKVRSLQRMRKALKKLTLACDEHGTVGECPLLEALSEDTEHDRRSSD
jgi:MerR family copper efflux transcriptional regulator